ncbi:MAG TPA: biotin carboxylase N-terminal domain-containing protein [Marmoricola sp.]
MISRLLVANRGEIARRVIATCRRLGIETVAVHSDADAGLPFVGEADLAVRLPGDAPAETYLRADLVVEAARRSGADAVHPGYGFLSENADFARAVLAAGRTWVGPSPEAIAAMGSKVGAKKLMAAAGVPVLEAPEQPTAADLPLLVKASAGGGGRGMRVVRDHAALAREVEAASAEAASAFGDGTVFVEPYVEHGRHVEVQVVGDRHGDVLVLGERDCSIQRRHQKVVEEAPAPDIDRSVVTAMHEAARRAASAIGYVGAGTVEFLYDPEREQFFFLEMNTRLQVEHPVTEAVFGLDLVELQLAVAEGAALRSAAPGPVLEPHGHAIEVRLYAEDPAHGWQPQSGRLVSFEIPHDAEFTRGEVRVDAGVETGSEVSTYYDAMLAKVIAWAPTRREAARRLAGALARARIHGVVTNRELLVSILRDEAFLDGRVSTDFLEVRPVVPTGEELLDQHLLLAAALLLAEDGRTSRRVQHGIPVAWRNVVSQPQRTVLVVGTDEHLVEWYGGRDGYAAAQGGIRVVSASPGRVVLEDGGVAAAYTGVVVTAPDGTREVHVDGPQGSLSAREQPRFTDPAAQVRAGSLVAPMPGTVVSVAVKAGDPVEAGRPVLVLEAMKMQHTVTAPTTGVVRELAVAAGDQVAAGAMLAVVAQPEGDEG